MGETPKPHIVLSFGAKERTKESIHLSPTLPYMEGLKKKNTEDPAFLYVLVSRDDAMNY